MRVVELSNHPGAMLAQEREQHESERRRLREAYEREAEEKREQVERANEETQRAYRARVAEHAAAVQRLRAEHDAMQEQGSSWWGRLRSRRRVRKVERRPPPPPPAPSLLAPPPQLPPARPFYTGQGAKLAAGIEGEQAVADSLAATFGEEWVLLRGYRNRRGEIDQLLLGPRGLVAIEVKYRNATVHCNGDEWVFEKFDRYGNRVEEGAIRDRRGRSPSRQLLEPAQDLKRFLVQRGQSPAILPVVVLSHPRAQLGLIENPTVCVVLDVGEIVELIDEMDDELGPEQTQEIERLILKDHEFHEKKDVV